MRQPRMKGWIVSLAVALAIGGVAWATGQAGDFFQANRTSSSNPGQAGKAALYPKTSDGKWRAVSTAGTEYSVGYSGPQDIYNAGSAANPTLITLDATRNGLSLLSPRAGGTANGDTILGVKDYQSNTSFSVVDQQTNVKALLSFGMGAGLGGAAAPAFNGGSGVGGFGPLPSSGEKIQLFSGESGSTVDYGIGVEAGYVWISVPGVASNQGLKIYGSTTLAATITSQGDITAVGTGSFAGGMAFTSAAATGGTQLVNSPALTESGAYWNGSASVADALSLTHVIDSTAPLSHAALSVNGTEFRWYSDGVSSYANGSAGGVSGSSRGALRYNNSSHVFELSENGAAYDAVVQVALAQTLTSKTLTSPVINGATSSGSTAIDFSGNSGAFKTTTGASTFGGSSNTFSSGAIGPATGQQHTLPAVASDTIALLAATQTLTNKTLTAPVLSGTATGTYTLGGTPTLTSPVIATGLTASGSAANNFGGSTGDFTTSTGALSWAGASGKTGSLVSTAAALTLTSASPGTWDSGGGTVKAATFDASSSGTTIFGGTNTTTAQLGGANTTSINFDISGVALLNLGSVADTLQWAASGGTTKLMRVATAAVDTNGFIMSVRGGIGGAYSATAAGTGGSGALVGGNGGTGDATHAAGGGGTATVTGGAGAADAGGNGGAGGAANITGGGGAASTTGTGGAGGSVAINPGAPGAAAAGSNGTSGGSPTTGGASTALTMRGGTGAAGGAGGAGTSGNGAAGGNGLASGGATLNSGVAGAGGAGGNTSAGGNAGGGGTGGNAATLAIAATSTSNGGVGGAGGAVSAGGTNGNGGNGGTSAPISIGNGSVGGAGGQAGGSGATGGTGGAGGAYNLIGATGGAGGAANGGTQGNGGVGTAIVIAAGAGGNGATGGGGGGLTLRAGAAGTGGAPTNGTVLIGATNTAEVQIGAAGIFATFTGTARAQHWGGNGTAPTIAVGNAAQLGTGPAAAVTVGTDAAGTITFTSGTAPAVFVGGTEVKIGTITFNIAYTTTAPRGVVVTPANAAAGAATSGATGIACYAKQGTTATTTWDLYCVDSGAGAFAGSTAYAYAYTVIQ